MQQIITSIKKVYLNNKGLILNILSAFIIKGLGLIINLVSMPLYITYFDDNLVLGLWFTLLSVLNWILSFDIGIGNGVRNHLTVAISRKDKVECKRLISSGYFVLSILTIALTVLLFTLIPYFDLHSFFNVPNSVIDSQYLATSVIIISLGILVSFFFRIISSILYALQLASANNLIHLVTSILLVVYLCFDYQSYNLNEKLLIISLAYAIIINIPLLFASIWVFLFSKVRDCKPNIYFITKKNSKQVLSLGIIFFIVQVLYMIITVTNEWFISKFFSPEYCVEYQAYFRIFSLVGSLFLLALAPVWSAVTKAYAEKNYRWIIKLQRLLNYLALAFSIFQLILVPLIQPLFDLWLGKGVIEVDYKTAFIFLLYGTITIWISIESTVVAGLGLLKTQLWGYSFAVLCKIILVILISKTSDCWSIVIFATAIGLLPYCIIQPLKIRNLLSKMESTNRHYAN